MSQCNGKRLTKVLASAGPFGAQFLLKWVEREIAFYRAEQGFKEERHREEMIALFQKAKAVYERLAK